VIDAFRTMNPFTVLMNKEPRQVTSNIGHLQKPSVQALIHGLNRMYYSLPIAYKTQNLEQKMLLNLNKQSWSDSIAVGNYERHCKNNKRSLEEMLRLATLYKKV
jgi:26S proteasome regulatory subunit N11